MVPAIWPWGLDNNNSMFVDKSSMGLRANIVNNHGYGYTFRITPCKAVGDGMTFVPLCVMRFWGSAK